MCFLRMWADDNDMCLRVLRHSPEHFYTADASLSYVRRQTFSNLLLIQTVNTLWLKWNCITIAAAWARRPGGSGLYVHTMR